MTVDNFVGSLVEMAKAYERMPSVEAELADARNTINSHLNTIQRLEAKLMDRANELEQYLSHIRELEVSRDDAQFHALEADDRTQRALEFIKATFGNAGALIQALEPPVVPTSQPEHAPAAVSMTEPTGTNSDDYIPFEGKRSEGFTHYTAPLDGPESPISYASSAPEVAATPGELQSPIGSSAQPMTGSSETAPSTNAEPNASASSDGASPDASRPYAGKTWSEVRQQQGHAPYSNEEWLAGGGTIDNYYA